MKRFFLEKIKKVFIIKTTFLFTYLMITGFQFRAAKAALGITAKGLAESINIHEVTLGRLGKTTNCEYLACHSKNILLLKNFFRDYGILLPEEHNTIQLQVEHRIILPEVYSMTRFQLICARTATWLTQQQLSANIRISSGTISLLENLVNTEYLQGKKLKISILKNFFEHLGISFPDDFTVTIINDPATFFIKK